MRWRAKAWPGATAIAGSRLLMSCGAVSLLGCEMFFGEFVEVNDPERPPAVQCESPYRCRGETLEACSVVGGALNFVRVTDCPEAELCSVELAGCMMCVPDDLVCQEDQLFECDDTGLGLTLMEDCAAKGQKCDISTARCETCLVGDSRCEMEAGQWSRLECQPKAGGRGWSETSCQSYACIESNDGAYCQNCETVGEQGCVGSGGEAQSDTLRTCSAELRWVLTPCAQGICAENKCTVE